MGKKGNEANVAYLELMTFMSTERDCFLTAATETQMFFPQMILEHEARVE
jgi:hypothetical protein